jgi:hypothetical protein
MLTVTTIRCHVCRKPFAAVRSDAKCCSPRCRQRAHRLSVTNVTPFSAAKPLVLRPIGIIAANEFVREHHRHLGRVYWGARFALAVADQSGVIQGVAIVSLPINKESNGGFVGEVRRVCTRPGAPHNCCSMLYAHCWKVWKDMGGSRLVTYTLKGETGTSLKAAGWRRVAASRGHKWGGSWDTHPRKGTRVNKEILAQDKWRWEITI